MKEYWDLVDEHGIKTGKTVLRTDKTITDNGEYAPSVVAWIRNSNGEFLISKRAPTKPNSPNMWEPTGGSVISGEAFLHAALREVREELGINLNPDNYDIYKAYTFPRSKGLGYCYIVTYVFESDADIKEVTLQPEETIDAMWASKPQIKELIANGEFIPFDYIDDFFSRY